MRKSVVLPAPFGPTTPTIPPGGSEKSRSSISRRSPKPLLSPEASTTTSPRRLPGRDVDLEAVDLDVRLLGQQRLVALQARLALGLARLLRHARPLHLARERAPARRLALLLERQPGLLLLQPAGVVALVRDALAAVELEDPARHVVEEVAVVGDRDDGAAIVGEEPLEPGHRLGVEVVRRLVEQQQVGRLQQQPAERDATALAARERADLGLARRHAQRVHGRRQRALEVPAVDRVDALLHLAHLGQRALHLVGVERLGQPRRDRVEAVEQVARGAHAVLDVLVDRARLVELRLLVEHADGRARRQQHVAADVRVDARHDAQQRALARAVRAEHADLRAVQERQRDAVEHGAIGRVALHQPAQREDDLLAHRRAG